MSEQPRQRLQPEVDAPTEEGPATPDPPSPPAVPSEQPLRVLDYRTGLTEAQRAHLDYLLARDREKREAALAAPSPAETLDELERDTRAGRNVKIDLRVASDEKVAWSEAARLRGMTTSEWIRAVLNLAAREVLTEPIG